MWVLFPASLWTQGSIISKRLSCSLPLRLHDPLQAFFKSDLDLTLRPSSYLSCPCLRRMVVTLPAGRWSVVAGTRGKADVHSSVRRPYQSADWLGSRELRTKTWLQLPTSAIASEYRVDSLGRSCRLTLEVVKLVVNTFTPSINHGKPSVPRGRGSEKRETAC